MIAVGGPVKRFFTEPMAVSVLVVLAGGEAGGEAGQAAIAGRVGSDTSWADQADQPGAGR